MKNVSDSLAGRLGIIKLFGLSQREKYKLNFYDEFYPTEDYIEKHKNLDLSYDAEPRLYFYRDKDMKEIDLIIEKNMTLYPIEIKKHADPSKDDIKNFSVLNKFTNVRIGEGAIISFYDKPVHITDNVMNIPISYI